MTSKKEITIPDSIKQKLSTIQKQTDDIIINAKAAQQTIYSEPFSFTYTHSASKDIMSPFERAQSICFISKYEHLPIFNTFEIFQRNNQYYLNNIPAIRHMLNEYRSIIFNQRDSVHYSKIHTFCYSRLNNRDPSKGLSIQVNDTKKNDITPIFMKILGERTKSIRMVLQESEFGYIYNGILQHSDHNYTDRFAQEYNSGELNYIFLKHVMLLGFIKESLYWHYRILNILTFPKLGPL